MLRLGLCCIFCEEPIKFRTTTAAVLKRMPLEDARQKLSGLCRNNADSLYDAINYCADNGIGCFRVNSGILPMKTHPEVGYELHELPDGAAIRARFLECGELARQRDVRTAFHPDQFVVLNSPRAEVVEQSIEEIEYQAEVAEWINADVVNIHGGGSYGDKLAALERLRANLDRLTPRARQRLTIENDDKIYTPADLLPVCFAAQIPLVYDVHHHRCKPDDLTEQEATEQALASWNREPLFHLSSPLEGWEGRAPHRHHDYIDVLDFPPFWRDLTITVEVEAKAKELAVKQLRRELGL